MPRRSLSYDDFALRLDPAPGGRFLARILHSVAGGGAHPFDLPVDPTQIDELMGDLGARVRASGEERHVRPASPPDDTAASGRLPADPEELGRRLYDAILGDRVGEAWARHLGTLDGAKSRGLRLRLAFDPPTLTDFALASLPWELLYQDRARGFMVRNRRTPLVRYLDVEHPAVLPPVEKPLRILAVTASPVGYPVLRIGEEEERLRAAWEKLGEAELELVRGLTLEQLRGRLLRGGFHVLHFMGHGGFIESPEQAPRAALLFETPDGMDERVPAALLAEALRGLEDLRLVVLNACDSGRFPRHRGSDPYSGVATSLVLAGVPAVVAMQFPISDRAAIAFGGGLFQALAAGDPVDAAVTEGRIAITIGHEGTLEWATPVLFSRLAPGAILGSLEDPSGPSALRQRVRDCSHLIEEKTRGFVGREFLVDAVDSFRRTTRRGYFQIVADPGIGKSAIVAELVRRRGWPHHFNLRSAFVVRPEAFLSNICSQLILSHGLWIPDLPAEATRDGSYLSEILGRISRGLDPGETSVFLVDALDESSRDGLEAGVNPLCLPPSLPDGIVAIVTTRSEKPDYKLRVEEPYERLELCPDSRENLADVRKYVESFLPCPGILEYRRDQDLREADFLQQMVDKSAGNFMYLCYVLPAIEGGDYRGRSIDELPHGLLSYYEGHFSLMQSRDREVWLRETLPVLGALAVAKDALPVDLIHAFSGIGDRRRVLEALQQLRPFLSVAEQPTADGPVKTYRFYHETFFEFIRDNEIVAVDLEKANDRLLQAYIDGKLDGLVGLGDDALPPED